MPTWIWHSHSDVPRTRRTAVDDAGFIFACYGVTLGALLMYAGVLLRRARRTGRAAKPEDLPWT
jgi:hypothetical protein